MTTTDYGDVPPPAPPPDSTPPPSDPPPTQVLRRSRTDRIGAGVAGGLGKYFGLDPVLFRVLFATAAFFGGAGILAYLIAWAAMPEEGTAHAPVDGWIRELRRRRVPFWIVAVGAAVLLWLIAFSWWAPGPFVPVVAVVVILIVFLSRRDLQARRPATNNTTRPVNLTKDDDTTQTMSSASTLVSDTRAWIADARREGIEKRRRAFPVRISVVVALACTLITLGIIDAVAGVQLQTYFWSVLGITAAGLLIGAALRRTPWSTAPLFLLAAVGVIAFGGSRASLHDGVGERQWQPSTVPAQHYKLALGNGVLDLRRLVAQTQPRTVYVTMGAGQVRVLTAKDANVQVQANVHFGNAQSTQDFSNRDAGVGVSRVFDPPDNATGPRIVVDVHVANGTVSVERG